MKKYPAYKDCGIEWIGEIPEHWEVKPIKYVGEIVLGKMLTPDDKGGYFRKPYLRAQNITWEKVDTEDIKEMWFSEKDLSQYRLKENDLLVSEGGEVGRTAIWKNKLSECYIQNSVHKITIKSKNNPHYYLYHFQIYGKTGYFDSIVNRVSIAHLTREKLKEIMFLSPTLSEQQSIANYLDRKTHLIDTLIEKKQKLIDLLKEQRAAIINHAVTKGLNPNVKLKDSGIEWLGEIPEHWEVKKGKYLFSIVNGYPPEQINFAEDGQHTYFRVDDLNEDGHGLYLTNGKAKFILGSTALYQKNLILFPKRGVAMLTNKVKITAIQNLFDTNLMGLKVFSNKADIVFLSYCLLTRRLNDIADTSTIPQINNKHIYPLFFPLPPLIEQKSISTFLNQYIHKTDSLILKIEKTIGHLKEYRTALISEVVTGKIDVRDYGEQEVISS